MLRKQLFEIHDQPWLLDSLRDAVTDTLQFLLNITDAYRPAIPRLQNALTESGAKKILDLCSGGGGPWVKFWPIAERADMCVYLSDKYPNLRAFRQAASRSRNIKFHETPVDALCVPPTNVGFRTLFTCFHHFRPQEARRIILDAANLHQHVAIFEVASRDLRTILLTFLTPLGSLIFAPFVRPFRWSLIFWTYVLPLVPFILLFDGLVSCLRSYSLRELTELIQGIDNPCSDWEIGIDRGGLIPVTYLLSHAREGRMACKMTSS
jgi:hypothetical protein